MRAKERLAGATIAATMLLAGAALLAPGAQAAAQPAWKLALNPLPANFAPGKSSEYLLAATNVGAKVTSSEPVKLKLNLPSGVSATKFDTRNSDPGAKTQPGCTIESASVSCTTTETVNPSRLLRIGVTVKVTATEGTLEASASVEGGGADPQEISTTAPVRASPVPFGFLAGFSVPASGEDGLVTTGAGAHPYQLTASLNFPTEQLGNELTGAGHPRNIVVNLPRGLLANPAAAPVLCSEAELTSQNCPEASQVGEVYLTTALAGVGTTGVETNNLYAMVPPPGAPAEFGFDALTVGVFGHLIAGIRSDGDYGAYGYSNDVIALGAHPIFNFQAQFWGNPTGEEHDLIRGACEHDGGKGSGGAPCSLKEGERSDTAFLAMPTECPEPPPLFKAFADSWEEPGIEHEASYESADLKGTTPAPVEECDTVDFKPTIEARPTTNLTDSPSGLDFTLHQPQQTDLKARWSAALRDAAIQFPTGMAVNPAQASGLGACTEDQIGFKKEAGIHFTKAPQSCPDASKIGSVQATSPLLVQRNEANEVALDPETGEALLEPVHGSVYLAQPFANPFGSLVAVYLAIEDEKTGTVAKVAGEGKLDPATGQLTTYFKESPELPIEDISVHVFGGSRGSLITPPTCTPYTTSADLTPWSAPEGKDALPTDSFQPSAAPGGGPCPSTEAQMPNAPHLSAGTTPPAAGKYSSLIFKLSREDGSQRLSKIDATLPPGLSARLAGVGQCSAAEIAKAQSREHPNQGALEQADPSCPASSQIGTLTVGAGAGPTPYYTQGHAYLSGPYKGAPLSFVFIVPAVAGPFDLGAVVSRTAVFLDPSTAQGHAVSDPLPTILHGVPVDLRSVALRVDRPSFTLNPTSCSEKAFGGSATTTLGQIAPLAERFQVGGCKSLPYKPKLTTRLFGPIHRGGHPRFRTIFTAKPGEANTKRIVLALPKSEFIDQGHFRTICTRVQFAAGQCPAGSIYGNVKATTPLLDYPLEGPVYLRSSSHELPDAVIALRGPPSQPIEVDVVGRIDSVNGGLRTTIETVPDAPLTKAIVTLQGAKKGLFQNSTNICKGAHRADLKLDGQNGKAHDTRPLMKADCPKSAKKKGGGKKRR